MLVVPPPSHLLALAFFVGATANLWPLLWENRAVLQIVEQQLGTTKALLATLSCSRTTGRAREERLEAELRAAEWLRAKDQDQREPHSFENEVAGIHDHWSWDSRHSAGGRCRQP